MAFNPAPLPALGLVLSETWPAGLFLVTGQDATLLWNRTVAGEYGEFTLTGQDAETTYSGTITAVNPAPLPAMTFLTFGVSGNYVLPCEPGTFTLSGQDAAVTKGKTLFCEAGTFGVSGAPGLRDMEIKPKFTTFILYGLPATTQVEPRTLTADYGSFAVTGQGAGMAYESSGSKVLDAEFGVFLVNTYTNAGNVTFERNIVMYCDYGTFTLSGQSATLEGPEWHEVTQPSGTWVYVTPSGGTWTEVDPDE